MPASLSRLPLLLALVAAAPPASAPSGDNPKVLDDLLGCRSIAEDKARLACFDQASGRFATAADQGDVRVIDKEQVTRTRRALFGFAMPTIDLFGGHRGAGRPGHVAKDEDEIQEVTAHITAVGANGEGDYVFTLDDGARWEQIEGVGLGRTPRSGDTVTIRRGMLGSFKLTVEKGPAMKVRRIG